MTSPSPLRALLVTGTDTNVGKTHVAAWLIRQLRAEGLRVGAYKPVCSGAEQQLDGTWLWDDLARLRDALLFCPPCQGGASSPLKNSHREGEAPAEPRKIADFPDLRGSAGASPSLFQQAVRGGNGGQPAPDSSKVSLGNAHPLTLTLSPADGGEGTRNAEAEGSHPLGLPHGAHLLNAICPQRFLAPLAPPIAAQREQRRVDELQLLTGIDVWRGVADVVVIEGVGGWLCPVSEEYTLADLAAFWQVPVLIVARRGLGTINHTLLTIESIRARQVAIAGVVLNEAVPVGDDPSVADNATEIERRSGVPVLGEFPHGPATELLRDGQPVRMAWEKLMGQLDPMD